MLVYSIALPPSLAPDVVTRELTSVVNGGEPVVQNATDTTELSFAQGDEVMLTLIDIDDAGLRSAPSPSFIFTATDTIPPPAPGELGVMLIREDPDTTIPPEENPPA